MFDLILLGLKKLGELLLLGVVITICVILSPFVDDEDDETFRLTQEDE